MNRADFKAIQAMIRKVMSRLRGMVTRTRVSSSAVTGQGQILTVQMLQGQERDSAEYFEPYGLAGAVPVGSEGVAIAVGGSRDQVVVVCASPKGGTPAGRLDGEVDLYGPGGQRIRMHTDGSISVLPGGAGAVYLGSDVAPTNPTVARNGDDVPVSEALAAWIANVTSALNVVPGTVSAPVPTSAGSVLSTSQNVRSN